MYPLGAPEEAGRRSSGSSWGSTLCRTRYTTPEVAEKTATNTITVMAIHTPVLLLAEEALWLAPQALSVIVSKNSTISSAVIFLAFFILFHFLSTGKAIPVLGLLASYHTPRPLARAEPQDSAIYTNALGHFCYYRCNQLEIISRMISSFVPCIPSLPSVPMLRMVASMSCITMPSPPLNSCPRQYIL